MRILLILTVCIFLFSLSASAQQSQRMTPVVQAVQQVQDAVVNIRTEMEVRQAGPFNDPAFDEFLGFGGTYRSNSLGTGVIIRSDGIIVTNYHVIDASRVITVILPDDRQFQASVIGGDSLLDIAVLRIVDLNVELPSLPLGTSQDLYPGETVIAIGNPYGLDSSVTIGVISNTRRVLKVNNDYSVFVQTDALINPGNSGGPLINLDGEVIGINTAIYQNAQGIGFAIPIDTVKRVLPDILRYRKIRRGYLGFSLYNSENSTQEGVRIAEVQPGSDAAQMGVQNGDTLVRLDDLPLSDIISVNYILRTFPPGETINAVIKRAGREYTVNIKLQEYPARFGIDMLRVNYGIDVAEAENVLTVTSTKYPQFVQQGDILVAVNGRNVKTLGQLDTIMADSAYEELTLTLSRNRRVFDILLKP